jgi:crotonobetaine/carnitine-CoA ligase
MIMSSAPHDAPGHNTYALRRVITSDDVIYNDLPMYHVGGAIANVVRAAWTGCEVAVRDRFSPNAFWDRIRGRRATAAILTYCGARAARPHWSRPWLR